LSCPKIHVIADRDEINVSMNDGTKIKAGWSASTRRPPCGAEVKAVKPLVAVKFGDSDNLRSRWVIRSAIRQLAAR